MYEPCGWCEGFAFHTAVAYPDTHHATNTNTEVMPRLLDQLYLAWGAWPLGDVEVIPDLPPCLTPLAFTGQYSLIEIRVNTQFIKYRVTWTHVLYLIQLSWLVYA